MKHLPVDGTVKGSFPVTTEDQKALSSHFEKHFHHPLM